MKKLSEPQKKLIEVSVMSTNVPTSLIENHANIWAAFNAGKAWQSYQSAQHSVHRTAFPAFCAGVVFGMFVMLILSALLSGCR